MKCIAFILVLLLLCSSALALDRTAAPVLVVKQPAVSLPDTAETPDEDVEPVPEPDVATSTRSVDYVTTTPEPDETPDVSSAAGSGIIDPDTEDDISDSTEVILTKRDVSSSEVLDINKEGAEPDESVYPEIRADVWETGYAADMDSAGIVDRNDSLRREDHAVEMLPSDNIRESVTGTDPSDPSQGRDSAKGRFEEGLESADVEMYEGHARYGSGPDTDDKGFEENESKADVPKQSILSQVFSFLFRIDKVEENVEQLHTEQEHTTFWARVKSFFAGEKEGVNGLPEVDDEENTTELVGKEDAEELLEDLDASMDSMSELSQEEMLRLQHQMQEKDQAEKTLSNVLKASQDTQKNLTANIK